MGYIDQTQGTSRVMGKESAFKQKYTPEQRKAEADKMLFLSLLVGSNKVYLPFSQKYPDRIPVICEKAEKSDIPGF